MIQFLIAATPTIRTAAVVSGAWGRDLHRRDRLDALSRRTPLGDTRMHRLGFWSASALCVIGVAYVVTLAVGFASAGLATPIVDPVLAVMEILTLLSGPVLMVLMVSIYVYAAPQHKVYGLVAVTFMVLMAGLTSTVHFVELTAVRQSAPASLTWPSTAYAIELLAWDLFLGLSLLFAAPVFTTDKLEGAIRVGLYVAGTLCIVGILGPTSGEMRLQFIAVLGYAGVLPVVCLLLAMLFRRCPQPRSPVSD
jgi:hypothetical protein